MRKIKIISKMVIVILYITIMSGCTPRIVSNKVVNENSVDDFKDYSNENIENDDYEKIVTPSDEKVTLKIVDWSDSTKIRREEFNEKFMKENPNITIEYTTLTEEQFKETIVSGMKSGNAPDLFPLPQSIKLSTAVSEGWFIPMNKYASNGFFNTFEDGGLNEGITNINNQTYILPESASMINTLMFYNKEVLRLAGFTEDNLPKTWSEFIHISSEISKIGKGDYYGIITSGAQTNRLELEIRSFASLAGAKCGESGQILLENGENQLNSKGMKKAFALYESLVDSGSFHPDSTLLKAPEARALFANNEAAFIIQGAWCISEWRKQNKDLDFGVMQLPVPDEGINGKLPYVSSKGWMGISSTCKNPDIAMKYLEGLFSIEYQSKLVEDGGFVSIIKNVNELYMKDTVMKDYYEIHKAQAALVPDPLILDINTSLVYEEVKDITPTLGDIVQGTLASAINYKEELYDLYEKTQKEWRRAINEVNSLNKVINEKSFEFSNWDNMKNYSIEDYKEKGE